MTAVSNFLPRWTRRVAMEGSGRDPLGLSRVSDEFTGFLLPSITTITPRARYFSFYPWAFRECLEAFESGGIEAFDKRLRCIDTAFAIGSRIGRTTELGISGIDQVNARFPEPSADERIDTEFPVLPSSPRRGAFAQAYGSSIEHLGLVHWTEEQVWKVGPGRGTKLAAAFASAIGETPYVQESHVGEQWLFPAVLHDSARAFSLDGIREEGAKAERQILTRIFFDLDDEEPTNPRSHRQATLGLLLHVLAAYDEVGAPPARSDINGSCLFWPHYYGSLYVDDDRSLPYNAHPCLEESRGNWRQFCVHQFFVYAAEEFLQAMLDAMAVEADGVTKDGMLEAMLETGFVGDLERATGADLPGPAALLEFFGAGEAPETVQKTFSWDHPLCEWWIYDQSYQEEDPAGPVTRLGRAFAIWTQLYAKWRTSNDPALLHVAANAAQEWCVGTAFLWGDSWRDEAPDWPTVIGHLIEVFVSRHEQIRFHKGKLDAAWFEILGGRFSRIQDLTPDFRSSRHAQVATVFQDLCLLEDGTPDEPLKPTDWGRRILDEVIRARS